MKFLRFVADYWCIPLILLGAFLLLFLRTKAKPYNWFRISTELGAIKAKREARELTLKHGAKVAKQKVLDKYEKQRKLLDNAGKKRIQELENDPMALAKVLERLSRSN